ncbi:reverse transcriptase domain-containing protein [Yersinia enterocolitica]|nr:hypothetical protein [Yersinia enterocolitica]
MIPNNEMQTVRPLEDVHTPMVQAWQWLCEQRTRAPDYADVWDIRWKHLNTGGGWLTALTQRVMRGDYRLTPQLLCGPNENRKAVWGAQDALVLKWVALRLQHQLPLHPSCEHVKGHGGGRQSIEKLHNLLTAQDEKKTDTRGYKWVCRTDIRGYYRNINKQTLLDQLQQHVRNPVLRDLVHQYIHYTVEDGGTFYTPEKGISRGCPLSPLMGALHLYDIDEHFSQQQGIYYARYMDDIIILAKTRWQLRKHTKRLMQWFSEYGFEAHSDKTQIGRAEKGFDWMGAWLTHEGVVDIAPRAKANQREKVRRLYEQLARLPLWKRKSAAQNVHARVSTYRKRWTIWAGALLGLASSSSLYAGGTYIYVISGGQTGIVGETPPPGSSPNRDTTSATPPSTTYGACITTNRTSCISPELTALQTPYGWGMKRRNESDSRGLVLIPHGTIHFDCPKCASESVEWLDLSTGEAITRGKRRYAACPPLPGDPARVSYYTSGSAATCPFTTSTSTWPSAAIAATYSSVFFSVYATVPLSAGPVSWPRMYAGVTDWGDPRESLAPSQIVVSGLTCTISGPTSYDLGTVVSSPTQGVSVGSPVNLGASGLHVTCTGANTAGQVVPVSYNLLPAGTSTATNNVQLTDHNQPSFYMLFTNDGTSSCNTNSPKAIPLDGLTPTKIIDIKPGDPMASAPVPLGVTLCSTGSTNQQAGTYSMAVTASIVSY